MTIARWISQYDRHTFVCFQRFAKCSEDGYASSVTVESDATGCHTITCNKTDLLTGNSSLMYHATVKAPHVVTRVIVDEDDLAERPH